MELSEEIFELAVLMPQTKPIRLKRKLTANANQKLAEIKKELESYNGVAMVEIEKNNLRLNLDSDIISEHLFTLHLEYRPAEEQIITLKNRFLEKAREAGFDGLTLRLAYPNYFYDPPA